MQPQSAHVAVTAFGDWVGPRTVQSLGLTTVASPLAQTAFLPENRGVKGALTTCTYAPAPAFLSQSQKTTPVNQQQLPLVAIIGSSPRNRWAGIVRIEHSTF